MVDWTPADEAMVERIATAVAEKQRGMFKEDVKILLQLHYAECPTTRRLQALEDKARGYATGIITSGILSGLCSAGGMATAMKLLGV